MATKKTTKKEEVTKQEQQAPEEVQQEQQAPEEVQQPAAGALKVGDKVTVTGRCYSNANAGGMFNDVEKREMYITQILKGDEYKRPIGVSRKKGGTRFGWIEEKSIEKGK